MRGISISIKLILASSLLIGAVISLFGFMNRMQARKIIDQSSSRLRTQLGASLESAGRAQLQLLSDTARLTLVRGDCATLQMIAQNTARSDARLTSVAVVGPDGAFLAHSDPTRTGKPAQGTLRVDGAPDKVVVRSNVVVDGKKAMTLSTPVTAAGTRLCTVFLAYDLALLERELQENQEFGEAEDSASLRNTLAVGAFAMLVGLLLTIVQGIRLTRPIQALARQADRMAGGDLEARVQVTSRDEIGVLAERFNHMADQVVILLRESQSKATLEKELAVASIIQATLVPDPGLVQLPGIEITGHFRAAASCGGDWWSHYQLTGDRTLVMVGDVTGHGVGSAMITAAAQGAAQMMLAISERNLELGALMTAMNAAIHATSRGQFVMTCFCSIYDPHARMLFYGNAGHNFAYHHSKSNGKLNTLVVRGNRLGDVAVSDYEVRQVRMKPGDTLIWYTDGIIECENLSGEEYGDRRFRDVTHRVADQPAEELLKTILGEATAFYDGVPQKDDVTLVVAKITQ